MGEVVPARTSPTLHPPSPPTACAVIILFKNVAVHQLSWLALQELKMDREMQTQVAQDLALTMNNRQEQVVYC